MVQLRSVSIYSDQLMLFIQYFVSMYVVPLAEAHMAVISHSRMTTACHSLTWPRPLPPFDVLPPPLLSGFGGWPGVEDVVSERLY